MALPDVILVGCIAAIFYIFGWIKGASTRELPEDDDAL